MKNRVYNHEGKVGRYAAKSRKDTRRASRVKGKAEARRIIREAR
jgi:hypothetical protein